MDKAFIVKGVQDKLLAAEQAIDQLQTRSAELTVALLSARTEMRMAATEGSDALSALALANARIDEARAQIANTHNALAALARRARITIPRSIFVKSSSDAEREQVEAREG